MLASNNICIQVVSEYGLNDTCCGELSPSFRRRNGRHIVLQLKRTGICFLFAGAYTEYHQIFSINEVSKSDIIQGCRRRANIQILSLKTAAAKSPRLERHDVLRPANARGMS